MNEKNITIKDKLFETDEGLFLYPQSQKNISNYSKNHVKTIKIKKHLGEIHSNLKNWKYLTEFEYTSESQDSSIHVLICPKKRKRISCCNYWDLKIKKKKKQIEKQTAGTQELTNQVNLEPFIIGIENRDIKK